MDEQLAFLRLIAERLDRAGLPYMVTGSLAMTLYGTPRMTRDIDVVVEIVPDEVTTLVGLFADDCVIDEAAVVDAVAHRGMFNVIHADWVVKADFIVRKDTAYRRGELQRRRVVEVGGSSVAVVAPEDLLLSKLVWAAESDSELQRRDAAQIASSAVELDREYLDEWAGELGVADLLAKAMQGCTDT